MRMGFVRTFNLGRAAVEILSGQAGIFDRFACLRRLAQEDRYCLNASDLLNWGAAVLRPY
jgi:hypothetical protein